LVIDARILWIVRMFFQQALVQRDRLAHGFFRIRGSAAAIGHLHLQIGEAARRLITRVHVRLELPPFAIIIGGLPGVGGGVLRFVYWNPSWLRRLVLSDG